MEIIDRNGGALQIGWNGDGIKTGKNGNGFIKPDGTATLGHVKAYWKLITPAEAEQLLKRNTQNRKHRPARVERYAKDMKNNRWRVTHQGIAFDRAGVIVDGQHRLHAIVKSGVAVWVLVVEGLDPVARLSVDNNIPRDAADSLSLTMPLDKGKQRAAICQVIKTHIYGNSDKMTADDLREEIAKYEPGLTWFCSLPLHPRLSAAPFAAAFVFAFKVDPANVVRAYEEYRTGSVTALSPMGRLREIAIGVPSLAGEKHRKEMFKKGLTALHMRITGVEKVTKLYASDERCDWFKKAY